MTDPVFDSAAERIHYSEAVDLLEQGQVDLVRQDLVDLYVRKGLWMRAGDALRLTDEGRRQHEIARRERSTDG